MAKKPASPFTALMATLRKAALAYPETIEDHPWGEAAFKVRKKIFLMMMEHEGRLIFTVKLPASHMFATELPNVRATGYGLGKSGWVTLAVAPKEKVDAAMLRDWLDESYRAVAPKAVVKLLDA
jgi:predicted DNA-binding protein (MmcQ/YjbR family)